MNLCASDVSHFSHFASIEKKENKKVAEIIGHLTAQTKARALAFVEK